jgi:hypothetical protein
MISAMPIMSISKMKNTSASPRRARFSSIIAALAVRPVKRISEHKMNETDVSEIIQAFKLRPEN